MSPAEELQNNDRMQRHGPVIATFGSKRLGNRVEVRWKKEKYWCSCTRKSPNPGGCSHVANCRVRELPTEDQRPPVDPLHDAIKDAMLLEPLFQLMGENKADELVSRISTAVRLLPSIHVIEANKPQPKPVRLILIEK